MLTIPRGITTVIGSGGKTTLLRCLGEGLRSTGNRVILCTTTKIYPFSDLPCITEPSPEQLDRALGEHGLICAGTFLPELGKLTAPGVPMAQLAELADYVLVEGDGSARLPLKAHLPQEPVIPAGSRRTICVVGLSGLGKPVNQVVHRVERFCALSGLSPEADVTAEALARVLNAENLADQYLLNQLDAVQPETAERLIALLQKEAAAVSLASGAMDRKQMCF